MSSINVQAIEARPGDFTARQIHFAAHALRNWEQRAIGMGADEAAERYAERAQELENLLDCFAEAE